MSFKPRPYQQEAIDTAISFFQEDRKYHAIQILPTGSGKSVVIANIASALPGKTIVFQPSKEILEQNFKKFTSYGYRAAIYSASGGMKFVDRITFATIGSVANKHHLFKQFQNIIIDECFPYDQYISTNNGKIKIGVLVNLFAQGKPVPDVVSYNERTNKIETKPVVAVSCRQASDLVELNFNKSLVIRTTRNHPFLTPLGWISAENLTEGDTILCTSHNNSYARIPNDDQKDFLLGSILGDGSVDRTRKTKNINRFRFVRGAEQKDYLYWKADLMGCPASEVEKNGFASKPALRFNTRVLCFRDDFCTKRYAIENLSAKSLAVSWMDDGHLCVAQNGGTLYATAESEELTTLLCEKIQAVFGIIGKVKTGKSKLSGKPNYFIKFSKESVQQISKVIACYIHQSMSYKLVEQYRRHAGSYQWNRMYNERGAVVLTGKRELNQPEPVYNIQVKDNETYVLTSSRFTRFNNEPREGVIVHNCHLVNPEQGMYQAFINSLENARVLGLTATPYRLSSDFEGAMLRFITNSSPRIFKKVIYYIQNDVLFNNGYLAKLEYYNFKVVDRTMLDTNSNGTDFSDSSIRSYYKQIDMHGQTIRYANSILSKRKSLLVFCSLIEEANKVSAGIPGSAVLTGDTDKAIRERLLSEFTKGKIRCIVNVGVLTTGFDYPALEAVLIARSTMSLALYYQIVGRVMRPFKYPDGSSKTGWVVDLGGNFDLFGKIETMRLQQNDKGAYYITNNGRQLTDVTFTKTA
jgi:DNA repair protein RadD